MYQAKVVVKNQNTAFTSTNFFPENHPVYVIRLKNFGRAGQAKEDDTAQAHCMLDI